MTWLFRKVPRRYRFVLDLTGLRGRTPFFASRAHVDRYGIMPQRLRRDRAAAYLLEIMKPERLMIDVSSVFPAGNRRSADAAMANVVAVEVPISDH